MVFPLTHFIECSSLVVAIPAWLNLLLHGPLPWPSSYCSQETIPTLLWTWVSACLSAPSSVPVCLPNSAFSSANSPFFKVSSLNHLETTLFPARTLTHALTCSKWWHLLTCCFWYNARDRTAHPQAVWLHLAICLDAHEKPPLHLCTAHWLLDSQLCPWRERCIFPLLVCMQGYTVNNLIPNLKSLRNPWADWCMEITTISR